MMYYFHDTSICKVVVLVNDMMVHIYQGLLKVVLWRQLYIPCLV